MEILTIFQIVVGLIERLHHGVINTGAGNLDPAHHIVVEGVGGGIFRQDAGCGGGGGLVRVGGHSGCGAGWPRSGG